MTNPEPIIIPTPSRPARIAALHAAGLFLADHLDLPMPAEVTMTVHNVPAAEMHRLATAYGTAIKYGETASWVAIPVTLETLHGIEITYVAYGAGDLPQTTQMDLPPRGLGVTTDPWADAIPRGRCTANWPGPENGRCVYPADHPGQHFFNNDETNGAHGA